MLHLMMLISVDLMFRSFNYQQDTCHHHRQQSSQALLQKTASTSCWRHFRTTEFPDCGRYLPPESLNPLQNSGLIRFLFPLTVSKFSDVMAKVCTYNQNCNSQLQYSGSSEVQQTESQTASNDLSRLDEPEL